jgi:AcrR family transcriptional regulator
MKTAPIKAARARTSAPRRRKGEILDAAARVFHRKGYESASIKDVADEVGILKGSLYYYIESKQQLLYEVLEDVHRGALAQLEAQLPSSADPLVGIRIFARNHFHYNATNIVKMGVFFRSFDSLSEPHKQEIVSERDRYEGRLRRLIRDGQATGQVCPDIDPKVASIAVLGMLNWIHTWYSPRGARSATELAEAYADFVVAGLGCSRDTHTPGHRRHLAAAAPVGVAPRQSAKRKAARNASSRRSG